LGRGDSRLLVLHGGGAGPPGDRPGESCIADVANSQRDRGGLALRKIHLYGGRRHADVWSVWFGDSECQCIRDATARGGIKDGDAGWAGCGNICRCDLRLQVSAVHKGRCPIRAVPPHARVVDEVGAVDGEGEGCAAGSGRGRAQAGDGRHRVVDGKGECIGCATGQGRG